MYRKIKDKEVLKLIKRCKCLELSELCNTYPEEEVIDNAVNPISLDVGYKV